jgi:hypothetical protein
MHLILRSISMAKGQLRSTKEAKKPKQGKTPAKPLNLGSLTPPIVTGLSVQKGKKKPE